MKIPAWFLQGVVVGLTVAVGSTLAVNAVMEYKRRKTAREVTRPTGWRY